MSARKAILIIGLLFIYKIFIAAVIIPIRNTKLSIAFCPDRFPLILPV